MNNQICKYAITLVCQYVGMKRFKRKMKCTIQSLYSIDWKGAVNVIVS